MRSGGQRAKGHTFERWFCRWFREAFGDVGGAAQRGWQSRGGGKEEADAETSVRGLPLPVHWECTHGAAPSVWGKYRQASRDAGEGEVPVVVVKRDRGRPMVFMSLEDFRPFLRAYVRDWLRRAEADCGCPVAKTPVRR